MLNLYFNLEKCETTYSFNHSVIYILLSIIWILFVLDALMNMITSNKVIGVEIDQIQIMTYIINR